MFKSREFETGTSNVIKCDEEENYMDKKAAQQPVGLNNDCIFFLFSTSFMYYSLD